MKERRIQDEARKEKGENGKKNKEEEEEKEDNGNWVAGRIDGWLEACWVKDERLDGWMVDWLGD